METKTSYRVVSKRSLEKRVGVFVCRSCSRPIGDVLDKDGWTALKFYNGKETRVIQKPSRIVCLACCADRLFIPCRIKGESESIVEP